MSIARIAAVLVALLSFGSVSHAESAAPLTPKNIKGFLNSLADVEKLSAKYGGPIEKESKAIANAQKQAMARGDMAAMMPSQDQMKRAASPLTSSLPEIRKSGGLNEMVATVKKHGFGSIEQWADVGDRSFRAFAAMKLESQMPDMSKQMEEARSRLKQSGMPAAQQEAMLKMMSGGSVLMKAYDDVPPADKKAIKPFMGDIEKMSDGRMQR